MLRYGNEINETTHPFLRYFPPGGVGDKHPHDSDHAECSSIVVCELYVSYIFRQLKRHVRV